MKHDVFVRADLPKHLCYSFDQNLIYKNILFLPRHPPDQIVMQSNRLHEGKNLQKLDLNPFNKNSNTVAI